MLLHNLQQNLISVLVAEHLQYRLRTQGNLQLLKGVFAGPVAANALEHNCAGVLLQAELGELINDSISDCPASILPKELVAELKDVVAVGIADYAIDVEVYRMHELLPRIGCLGTLAAVLKLAHSLYHLLDHAHCVFVERVAEEVSVDYLHEVYCVRKWEEGDDFLQKMSGVGMLSEGEVSSSDGIAD